MGTYKVPIAINVSLLVIRRSRGVTTRRGFVVFTATGGFEQQLKLSDAFSQASGHICPGTAMVPFSWLQVIDPSSGTVTGSAGTGVGSFVTGWVGTIVAGAGCTVVFEVQPAARIQMMRKKMTGLMKRLVQEVIRVHRSGLR